MKTKEIPLIVIAGGLATRMHQHTKKTAKSMLLFNNKPFIHYQLLNFKSQGFKKIIFCLSHFSFQIIDYLEKNKSKYKMDISYVLDGDKKLGTGGAIKNAILKNKIENIFFIIYGDTYLRLDKNDILKKYKKNKLPFLMTIYKNKNSLDKSNISILNNKFIKYFDNKKLIKSLKYIDYGLSLIDVNGYLRYSTRTVFDLGEFFKKVSMKNLLTYNIQTKRFYEIGSEDGFNKTLKFLNKIYK